MGSFQEYEFFGKWIQNLSERRQAASQTYLTVNTAIFTVLAFLVKDAGFRGWGLVLVSLPLFVGGAMACLIWQRIINDYRQIIGWHYEQLRDMEKTLEGSSQIFTREWEAFFLPRQGKERFGFSRLEIWLPGSFLTLYAIYTAGLVVATLGGWI
ncbi:MAG: hypothetical protein ACK2UY_14215 [Anaerolineae bacterium]